MNGNAAISSTPGLGKWLATRARALRAFSFPLSVLPVLIATSAALPFAEWNWWVLIASALGVLLLHATGNLLNDYFDFRSAVDRRLADDEGRPGRLLVRGELVPRDILVEAAGCLCLAAIAGSFLLWQCGFGLLWFGLAAAFALYAYTGPPFMLKYRAMGELVVFLSFGPILMMGAAYAQTGRLDPLVLILSIPVACVTAGVLLGNNMRDRDEDRAANIKTLAHKLGRSARVVYSLSILVPPIATACLAGVGLVPKGAAISAIALIPAILLFRKVSDAPRLPDIDARTAQYAALFFVVLLLGVTFFP